MDETHDLIRAVRDARFKYIRNFMPWIPYTQPLTYAELGPTLQSMRRQHAEGKLNAAQSLFFRPTKPPEELYDTEADPHELVNLADAPEHAATLERMRDAQQSWANQTLDLGLIPEPDLHARCDPAPPYVVARSQMGSLFPLERIRTTVLATNRGRDALPMLFASLENPDPAVRYWAVTGISVTLGLERRQAERASKKPAERSADDQPEKSLLRTHLQDGSPTVRVAAARAMLQQGDDPPAFATLTKELASEHAWVRHHAALGLAELGSRATPSRDALERALKDSNEYVVRVVKRALRDLDKR
jgi:uncharacterized sulfatase